VIFSPQPAIDWQELFGNDRAVEIEIGSGKGAFLLAYAAEHPELNVLGIENQPRWVRWIEERLGAHPHANARVLCADAALIVSRFVRDDSVRAYHLYFPDPWWKRRHHKRRVVQASLAGEIHRTLEPGGILHLATDVADRFASMKRDLARAPFEMTAHAAPTPSGRPLTNFEAKYRAAGRQLHYATLQKPVAPRS
jgi:tRNA (guanine-N7-)-methyltransferase